MKYKLITILSVFSVVLPSGAMQPSSQQTPAQATPYNQETLQKELSLLLQPNGTDPKQWYFPPLAIIEALIKKDLLKWDAPLTPFNSPPWEELKPIGFSQTFDSMLQRAGRYDIVQLFLQMGKLTQATDVWGDFSTIFDRLYMQPLYVQKADIKDLEIIKSAIRFAKKYINFFPDQFNLNHKIDQALKLLQTSYPNIYNELTIKHPEQIQQLGKDITSYMSRLPQELRKELTHYTSSDSKQKLILVDNTQKRLGSRGRINTDNVWIDVTNASKEPVNLVIQNNTGGQVSIDKLLPGQISAHNYRLGHFPVTIIILDKDNKPAIEKKGIPTGEFEYYYNVQDTE